MGLEVEKLSCRRGTRLVLDGVEFSLGAGEALMLRGPNGVGKSTLLRALAGLVPCQGAVRLDGASPGDDWQNRVAYSGHADAIKPQLSIDENLRFWAALFGGEARDVLTRLDLAGIAEKPAGICSAGQKKRAGLARLLLAPRRLWLLDEPTVSLDAASTALFAGAIRAHLAEGGMAVIATHVDLGLDAAELRLEPLRSGVAQDPFAASGLP